MLWFLCETISHNPWVTGSEVFVLDYIENQCANRIHEKESIKISGEKELTTINDGDVIFSLIANFVLLLFCGYIYYCCCSGTYK